MAMYKLAGGWEDLTFGMGTETQQREGGNVYITQINGANIPYSSTASINEEIDRVESLHQGVRNGLDLHEANVSNPHGVDYTQTGAAAEQHTHPLTDLPEFSDELATKVDKAGDFMTGKLDVRDLLQANAVLVDIDGAGDSLIDFGATAHIVFNTTDRDFSVKVPDGTNVGTNSSGNRLWHAGNFDAPGHTHSNYFLKNEHVEVSDGVVDAGLPIVLNGAGKLDISFLEESTLHYIGNFTPTTADEYPDETSQEFGSVWDVIGVDDTLGYTFDAGDLAGRTVMNGDFMIWGLAGWSIMKSTVDPTLYYRLDGTASLEANLAAGGFKLVNLADGTNPQDAVTMAQIQAFSTSYVNIDGSSIMTGNLVIGDGNAGEELSIRAAQGTDGRAAVILRRVDDTIGGVLYHSDTTDQVVLARYAGDGLTIESMLILGSDGVSISGADGGVPVIEDAQDITTKDYVDTELLDALASYLPLAGGIITGALTINADLTVTGAIDFTGDLSVTGAIETTDEFVTGIYPATSNSVVIFTDDSGTATGLPGIVWDNANSVFAADSGDGVNNTIWDAGNFDPTGYTTDADFDDHTTDVTNSHNVTKAQVGLSAVNNTSDAAKPVSTATQTALDLKFDEADHVTASAGSADAGKPVVLGSDGKLDATILGSGLYLVAMYTPEAATEYPDTTGEDVGAYWGIEGVDEALGYTFVGGDLTGTTLHNGDAIVLGSAGWGYFQFDSSPDLYYLLDGTKAITAPFAGGGQLISNIADGVADTDAVTMGQINALSTNFVAKDGDVMTGDLDIGDGTALGHLNLRSNGSLGYSNASRIDFSREDNLRSGLIYMNDLVPANPVINIEVHDIDSNIAVFAIGFTEVKYRGAVIWHSDNFDPADKLDATATAVDSALLTGLTPALLPISTATQTALDTKASGTEMSDHLADVADPHNVTKVQVGLGEVNNTSDADKPISTATQTALDLKATDADLTSHTGATGNPHSVTAAQVGALPVLGGTLSGNLVISNGAEDTPSLIFDSVGNAKFRMWAGAGARLNFTAIDGADITSNIFDVRDTGHVEILQAPANANDAVRKQDLDAVLGTPQTWQDMTATRVIDIDYTNDTDKPITLCITGEADSAYRQAWLFVDGVQLAISIARGDSSYIFASIIIPIPVGSTYRLESSDTPFTTLAWFELRGV